MHLKNAIKKMYYNKKVRFLIVGIFNTGVGYGTYALFIYLGLHYFISQTFSTVIGVIHSYFWNKYFTFGSRARSAAEALRFALVYVVSYVVSLILQYLLIEKAGVDAYLAGFLCLIATTLISYTGHNFFSFKSRKKEGDSKK